MFFTTANRCSEPQVEELWDDKVHAVLRLAPAIC